MMTAEQLEVAAREFCRLSGIDPDTATATAPPPNPDGTVNLVCLWRPTWEVYAQLIAQHDVIRHCMELAAVMDRCHGAEVVIGGAESKEAAQ